MPQPDRWAELAKFFGDTSRGRVNGRLAEAQLNEQRDYLRNQQYATGSNNALQGAKFFLDAPNVRAHQAVRGDVLANAQDASVSGLPDYIHVGKVDGGLRPSLLSPNTREVGRGLSRNALDAQRSGGDRVNYPTAPELTPIPQAGALDSALNIGAGVTGGLGALGNFFNPAGGGRGPGGRPPADTFNGPSTYSGSGTGGGDNANDWLINGGQNLDPSGRPVAPPPPMPGLDDAGGYYDEQGNYIPGGR